MTIKSPILYRECKICKKSFLYKESVKVRQSYSKDLKCVIGHVNQQFCSKKCFMYYHNKIDNPAKKDCVKQKLRNYAIKKGTHHMNTKKAREKQRKTISGSGHWNWKGGLTIITKKIRNSFEYKQWRKSIFERDNYTCVLCGIKNGFGKSIKLQADHIKPFSQYPKLRFSINNGRTLCIDCHKKTDTYMGRVKNYKR